MKKIALIAATASMLMLSACGQPITYQDKEYPTYGLFNETSSKSDKMCYETSIGNVIWSIILIETIIAPVYFIGFSLYNPVGPKGPNGECGIDVE